MVGWGRQGVVARGGLLVEDDKWWVLTLDRGGWVEGDEEVGVGGGRKDFDGI